MTSKSPPSLLQNLPFKAMVLYACSRWGRGSPRLLEKLSAGWVCGWPLVQAPVPAVPSDPATWADETGSLVHPGGQMDSDPAGDAVTNRSVLPLGGCGWLLLALLAVNIRRAPQGYHDLPPSPYCRLHTPIRGHSPLSFRGTHWLPTVCRTRRGLWEMTRS